jgi:excisionase family DNA binding protein
MNAEARLLASLDGFRDALAEYIATRRIDPPSPAALLTISNAARVLGVSRSTASRWADSGELPTVMVNGRRWVARADLEGRIAGSPRHPLTGA